MLLSVNWCGNGNQAGRDSLEDDETLPWVILIENDIVALISIHKFMQYFRH